MGLGEEQDRSSVGSLGLLHQRIQLGPRHAYLTLLVH